MTTSYPAGRRTRTATAVAPRPYRQWCSCAAIVLEPAPARGPQTRCCVPVGLTLASIRSTGNTWDESESCSFPSATCTSVLCTATLCPGCRRRFVSLLPTVTLARQSPWWSPARFSLALAVTGTSTDSSWAIFQDGELLQDRPTALNAKSPAGLQFEMATGPCCSGPWRPVRTPLLGALTG